MAEYEARAQELGANDFDPLGEAGYLQSLLFRAARLVTDTGIHYKRWSREQATMYMVDTIGNTKTRAQREVERYFAGPGLYNAGSAGKCVPGPLAAVPLAVNAPDTLICGSRFPIWLV